MSKLLPSILKALASLVFILGLGQISYAQATYPMSNNYVTDCEGTLTDSQVGQGDFPTGYDHNEDFVFTICVPGSGQITFTLTFLQLESSGDDYLVFYDGDSPSSPEITTIIDEDEETGNVTITITSTGDCLTIRFVSDASVNAEGFVGTWTSNPPQPVRPNFLPIANVPCESQTIRVQLDTTIKCASVNAAFFDFFGPAGGSIVSAVPINCDADGNTTEIDITFASPLDQSGNYAFEFDYTFTDDCNITHQFLDIRGTFQIVDCPLVVQILGATDVCRGSCVTLYADALGGDPSNYQYSWQPFGETTPTIQACPNGPTQYIVTVTDGQSQPASDTVFIDTLAVPQAGPDLTFCRFDNDTMLIGAPTGGNWGGPGIINGNNGTFRARNAGPGTHKVYYSTANGCYDSIQVTVNHVFAGWATICVGAPPTQLNGGPDNNAGTWAGPFTDTGGIFTPPANADTVFVTYTESVNGCQADARVIVTDTISVVPDTFIVCVNEPQFRLDQYAYPTGGYFTGNGINNAGQGRFNPAGAGVGIHKIAYNLVGCTDTVVVEVRDIPVYNDTVHCPTEAAYQLPVGPAPGFVWSGNGVTQNPDQTFSFDPNFNGYTSGNVVLTYLDTVVNCGGSITAYLIVPNAPDTVFSYCEYEADQPLVLSNLPTTPANNGLWQSFDGSWDNDTVRISNLAAGNYKVYFEAFGNGCLDSIGIEIRPQPQAYPYNPDPLSPDTLTCPESNDFALYSDIPGGIWTGVGVTDPNGVFSATSIGAVGKYNAIYTVNGCVDTVDIQLQKLVASVSGLAPFYCLTDQEYDITGSPIIPILGRFKGPGLISGTPNGNGERIPNNDGTIRFSVLAAGPGQHEIIYLHGEGNCLIGDTAAFEIYEPISVSASITGDNPICLGDATTLKVEAVGGKAGFPHYFTWSPVHYLIEHDSIIEVKPKEDITYRVIAQDFCSYNDTTYISVSVYPPVDFTVATGAPGCNGQANWAKITPIYPIPPNIDITWGTDPINKTDSIYTAPGRYSLTVTDQTTGCFKDTSVQILDYPPVSAEMIVQPNNNECQPVDDPWFNFLNISSGADQGYYDMGDGSIIPFDPNQDLYYEYPDTGAYHIFLYIENEIGCFDTVSVDVCIETKKIFNLPNAFTPYKPDGNNDFFPPGGYVDGKYVPLGYNIFGYDMTIYNRWGEVMYETDGKTNDPWNGTLNNDGRYVTPDVYIYRMNVYFSITDIRIYTGRVTLVK